MRPFLDIADAIFRQDRPIAALEAVGDGGADAAAGVDAGDDHRANPGYPCACRNGQTHLRLVVDGEGAVREQMRRGSDHIKIKVLGGVASPYDPLESDRFSDAEISAAVEEAEAFVLMLTTLLLATLMGAITRQKFRAG